MSENIKNKWWRPTKYQEDFINKVDEYLEQCEDIETTFHKTMWEKSDSYDRILKVNLPSIEWFALYLNVNKSSIYEWSNQTNDKWEKVYPEFSNALEKISTEQKKRLIEEWLAGNYNPTIAKLVLSANHGMKETTVQENTWKDWWPVDNKLSIEIITRNVNSDEKA